MRKFLWKLLCSFYYLVTMGSYFLQEFLKLASCWLHNSCFDKYWMRIFKISNFFLTFEEAIRAILSQFNKKFGQKNSIRNSSQLVHQIRTASSKIAKQGVALSCRNIAEKMPSDYLTTRHFQWQTQSVKCKWYSSSQTRRNVWKNES